MVIAIWEMIHTVTAIGSHYLSITMFKELKMEAVDLDVLHLLGINVGIHQEL